VWGERPAASDLGGAAERCQHNLANKMLGGEASVKSCSLLWYSLVYLWKLWLARLAANNMGVCFKLRCKQSNNNDTDSLLLKRSHCYVLS
jgi:hypothetical protein